MDQFYYDNTNNANQNLIQKFRQSSFVVKKPGFLFEKLKTLTSPNFLALAETSHMFPNYQCLQKGVQDFFILFRS